MSELIVKEEPPAGAPPRSTGTFQRLDPSGLAAVMGILKESGYELIGPVLRDGAICLDTIRSIDELPRGWKDDQNKASYRLAKNGSQWFGYTATPGSWKKYLFPPLLKYFTMRRKGKTLSAESAPFPERKMAFIGVRPCDLAAIGILDRVFLRNGFTEPQYAEARKGSFIATVSCATPGNTCFCASMGTGPRATGGFDIHLIELRDAGGEFFLAEAGSEEGRAILLRIPGRPASEDELAGAERQHREAVAAMRRKLEPEGLREVLSDRLIDARWETIGQRCLACANCTLVCPTCFCTTVDDQRSLNGEWTERIRRWDSCFTLDFSHIHGGSVRSSFGARYRQWMTHKLASWNQQFGTSGCVGCGRCITWCPVGIDITEEAAAFRQLAQAKRRNNGS